MRAIVHAHLGAGARIATLVNATCEARSWVRNEPGSALVTLSMEDAQISDVTISASNVYVVESDTGLAPWVGYLPGRIIEDGERLHLPLRELTAILDQRFTGANETYSGGAGDLFHQVFLTAQRRLPFPLRFNASHDPGPYTAQSYHNQSLLQVAQGLERLTGRQLWAEYRVTIGSISAELHWGTRRGLDRTDEVLLEEGRNVQQHPRHENRIGQPLLLATVIGGASTAGFTTRPQATGRVEPAASAPVVAPPQDSTEMSTLGTEQVIVQETVNNTRAAREAAEAAIAASGGRLLRVVVAGNQALWAKVGMDDDVRVRLPRYNLRRGLDMTARVIGMQPDELAGILDLALEVAA